MQKVTYKNVANALDKTASVAKSVIVVIGAAKALVDAIADLSNKIK